MEVEVEESNGVSWLSVDEGVRQKATSKELLPQSKRVRKEKSEGMLMDMVDELPIGTQNKVPWTKLSFCFRKVTVKRRKKSTE